MSDTSHRHQGAAPSFDYSLSSTTDGYQWSQCDVGQSDATVHRLYGKPSAPDLFLKRGQGETAAALTDEMARLGWLAAYLPVPQVEYFVRDASEAVLVTTALDGRTAADLLDPNPATAAKVIDALAEFLTRLHAIPVSQCPFNSHYELRLSHAQRRIAAGLVDIDDFDAERQGWTAEQVWAALQRRLPLDVDAVVTHGDFSLDNLLLKDGKVVGCVDVGRLGTADRYQDLAIMWNCLREYGPLFSERFLSRYGLAHPDRSKLEFYLLLDELF